MTPNNSCLHGKTQNSSVAVCRCGKTERFQDSLNANLEHCQKKTSIILLHIDAHAFANLLSI